MRFSTLLSLLTILAPCLAACGDAGSVNGSGSSRQVPQLFALQAAPVSREAGLIEQVMLAPSITSYFARRKVSSTVYDRATGAETLTYLEQVASDGDGLFAVTPESVVEPKLDRGRLEVFKLVQKGREEFFYNHRDFRVRDLDLFFANYLVVIEPGLQSMLSRNTLQISIRRREQAETRYVLDVDQETGLVLHQREYDLQDRLVSEVEYLELTVGPLSPEIRTRLRRASNASWRPAAPRDGLDSLAVVAPRVPPSGFQLLEHRIVSDPLGSEWYELIYGDGVEQLFVLYALSPSRTGTVLADEEVVLYRHGSWTVVEGLLSGERVIALGKVSRDALILTLQSCL